LGHLVSYGDSYVFKALDLSGFHYEPVEAIAGQPKPVKEETPEPEQPELTQVDEEPVMDEEEPQEEIQTAEEIVQPVTADVVAPEAVVEEEVEVPASRSNTIW